MLIGVCQTDIIQGDKKYNLITAEDYILKCAAKGASLVLFPELSMTGFVEDADTVAETKEHNETIETIAGYSVKYNVAVGCGFVYKDETGAFTNHYAIVDNAGKVICDYTKIHPFSLSSESKVYEGGSEVKTFTLEGITFAPFICYDLRFPEIFRAVCDKAQVIIVPANWPAIRDGHWRRLLAARALENQCYVIGINRVGNDKDGIYIGDSCLMDSEGDIIDMLEANEPGIMIVDVDYDSVMDFRSELPAIKDRKPKLYKTLF